MTPEDLQDNFVTPTKKPTIIKVIGVGGGGNNAVKHMYEQGIEDVTFVICNTDRQALANSPVPVKVMIGTSGLGAGNVPEIARQAAEESAEDIKRLFDDDTQMVFITAGMGGGTGTGAGPVVARLAREKGLLTIGIVTIPFLFEGQRKIIKALEGAAEMSKFVDALLVINNERLTEIYPDLEFMNAFGKADDTLSIAARGISELITTDDAIINIDFHDVDTTLRNGGAAVISQGYGEGENRVTKAINDALNSPLLKDRDIFGSKRLLFNIYFDPDAETQFVMREADELTSFISNIDPSVDVIWGLTRDHTLGNKIKVTLLAAGFKTSERDAVAPKDTPAEASAKEQPIFTDDTPEVKNETEILAREYGVDKAGTITRNPESVKQIVFSRDQLENDALIEAFENSPTFTRDRRTVDSIKNTGKQEPEPQNEASSPLTDVDDKPKDKPSGTIISF
jgi:cell division protein FtsZ